MKRNSHIGIYLQAAVVMSILFVACNEDRIVSNNVNTTLKTDVVSFGINKTPIWTPDIIEEEDNKEGTRSAVKRITESLPMDAEGENEFAEELYIYMIEEDCPIDNAVPASRAESEENTPTYEYGVYAYMGEGNVPTEESPYGTDADISHFMSNLGLTADGIYYTDSGDDIYWPGYGWLQFLAYTPYLGEDTEVNSFSINAPQNTLPVITYHADPQEPDNHCDLMVGVSDFYNGNGIHTDENGENMGQVAISLEHILSKIQIKKGNVVSGTITSVAIENVYGGGTYTFSPSGKGTWNCIGEQTVDYSQSLVNLNNDDNTQVVSEPDVLSETETMLGKPLYLVPQAMSDNTLIKISISVDSYEPTEGLQPRTNTYIFTKELNKFIQKWESNKQYSFIISTPAEVKVNVEDKVENEGGYDVKKDLIITNNGLAPVFVRVALTGSWVVEREFNNENTKLVVYDWKPEEQGDFNWGSTEPPLAGQGRQPNSRNWCKGEDGFYYYMKVLMRGETIGEDETLFDSYTLTTDQPPMDGAYLELSVKVQACMANPKDIEAMWPEDVRQMYPFNQ